MHLTAFSGIKGLLHVFPNPESSNANQQKSYDGCTRWRDDGCKFFRWSPRPNDFVPRSIGSCPRFSAVLDTLCTDTRPSSAFAYASSCCYVSLRLLFIAPRSSRAYGSAGDFSGPGVMSRQVIIAPALIRIPVPTLLDAAVSASKVRPLFSNCETRP